MASVTLSKKLSNLRYNNWVKASLAVLITKKGIEHFVEDEIKQFQQKCLTDICNNQGIPLGTICTNCCTENVVECPTDNICNVKYRKCSYHKKSATSFLPAGCPNKICHNFKTEIQKAHRYNDPSYKNTDATQWCRKSWEVAKCFMPPDGYKDVVSASETDFNGVNSVIINCECFKTKVTDDLSKKGNIFEKGREIGKVVRHSPSLEVEDKDLKQYFIDLENLLSDTGYLISDNNATLARERLSKLQNDKLLIGKDDVRKVLDDVAKAAHDNIKTLDDGFQREAAKRKLELIETTLKSLSLEDKGEITLAEVDKVLKSAIDELENKTIVTLERIIKETKKGVEKMKTECKSGVSLIHEATDEGPCKILKESVAVVDQVKQTASEELKKVSAVNKQTEGEEYIAAKKNIEKPSLKRSLTSDINIPILKRNKKTDIETPSLKRNLTSDIEKPSLKRSLTSDINIPILKRNKRTDIETPSLKRNLTSDIEKPSLKRSLTSDINIPILKRNKRTDIETPSLKRNLTSDIEKPSLERSLTSDINIPILKRNKRTDIETPSLKRNLTSGDNDEVLDPFLCSGSLEEIGKLIESGKLPSQKILDEMCQIYERKSKEITITCKAICEHIKSKHAAIAYVWAAYAIQNPHRITFVVIVEHKSEGETSTEPLKLDKLITYSFVSQYVGEFNSEGPEVLRQETTASEGLDEESYQKLQSCISKHSEDLMKRHKYLSIISACSKRSKGFGASWNLLPEKCIVLYVQKKNYIPIDEEPFKTNYDDIPVDVREGAFIPFGRTAKDLLDPVKMGSQIGGDIYNGTLGFFIDHPQFGICGLTCAHVLLTQWEMTQLKTNHSGTLKWPLHRMCKNVYQPADNQSVLGHTVQVIYKEGSDENCGMEVALFRVTDRHPKSPSFPDVTGSNVATSIKYDSWRMCSTDRLNKKEDAKVVKFGSKTELSHGIIRFDTISVKSLDAYPLVHEYAPIKLFKQIEVKALNGIPFADKGDSGAPVFVVGKISENKCIGIIEGGTTNGTVVVTPIVPILAELDVPCLKKFDTERDFSNIQNKIDNLETRVQSFCSDVRGIDNNMQTVKHDIQNIKRSLQGVDLQTMSGDIQMIKQLLLNLNKKNDSSLTNSQNDEHGIHKETEKPV